MFSLSFLLLFFACRGRERIQVAEFSNILDIKDIPDEAEDRSCYCFSDLGAWIGFGLPEVKDTSYWGGFTGPFLMEQGKWLGPSLLNLSIKDIKAEKTNILYDAVQIEINYFPGRLSQRFKVKGIEIKIDLIFISERTAAVRVSLYNRGEESESLQLGWEGEMFTGKSLAVIKQKSIVVDNPEDSSMFYIQVPESYQVKVESCSNTSYKMVLTNPKIIKPGQEKFNYIFCSLIFKKQILEKERVLIEKFVLNPDKYFKKNRKRWNRYIKETVRSLQKMDKSYQKTAVKSLVTLLTNWRSKAGDLYYDGLFPSYSPGYFNGFWAWDSWKHSAVLASFAPELAKDQIRTMFAYQNADGMIPDVIYKEKKENNWRNTKPPLAAWAVWRIFKKTGDFIFIREMLPKLVRYHNWWYKFRDHDGNG